jgi:archaemetzincin
MRLFILIFISIIFITCENSKLKYINRQPKVAIQPFDGFPRDLLQPIKSGIDSMYKVETVILPPIDLPKSAYYKPRNRYRADTLIHFLKRTKAEEYDKIIGLSPKDISHTRPKYIDYGILGLGFLPGESCVISTFRVQRGAINRKQFISRIRKVSIHELGHNFGLPHCTFDDKCLMQSAKGSVKTIDKAEEILCENCRKQITFFLR